MSETPSGTITVPKDAKLNASNKDIKTALEHLSKEDNKEAPKDAKDVKIAIQKGTTEIHEDITDKRALEIGSLYKRYMNQGFRFTSYPGDGNHIIVSHKNTPIFMIESSGSGKDKSFAVSAIGEPTALSYMATIPADKFGEYLNQFNKPGKTLNDIVSDVKEAGINGATEAARLKREIESLPFGEKVKIWTMLSLTTIGGGYMPKIEESVAKYVAGLSPETKKDILISLAGGPMGVLLSKINK